MNFDHVLVLRARSALLRSGGTVRARVMRAVALRGMMTIAVMAHGRGRVVRVMLITVLSVAIVVIILWLVHDTKGGSKERVIIATRVVVGHERYLRCLDVLLLCCISWSLRLHVRLVIGLKRVVSALRVLNVTIIGLGGLSLHFPASGC